MNVRRATSPSLRLASHAERVRVRRSLTLDLTLSRCAALAVLVIATLASAGAEAAEALRHGEQITAAHVGPLAGGIATKIEFAGGEIKSGATYPFAKEIAASAAYDGFSVEGPHLLIEGVTFTGPLDISRTTPVVLRGVTVRVPPGSPWSILVRPQAGAFHMLWSEAGGDSRDGKPPAGALDIRNGASVVYRSRLTRAADGIDISGSNVRVIGSLIDALAVFPGSHNDGIQLAATAHDVTIDRSKIHNPNPQTSCLYLLGRSITVSHSHLSGGGWTVYGGAKNNGKGGHGASAVAISDTIFGREYAPKSGGFGPVTYWDAGAAGNTWRDNRFNDGTPVTP